MTTAVGHIHSEEIEPTAALVVGRLFARYQAAEKTGDENAEYSALNHLWWAVNALNSLSIAVETATHFSIASNNHVRMVGAIIRNKLKIDPETHPMWKFR